MAEEPEIIEGASEEVDIFEMHQDDLMRLFDEMGFIEKWKRVAEGLKHPPTSGPYKWAKLQLMRLASPVMAVIVPVLMLGLITLFASLTPEPTRVIKVKVIEPEPVEELEEIEEPIFEPEEPPDPVEVDFTPDAVSNPSEIAAPTPDVSVQPAEFDSVAMVKSPVVMKGIIGSRNPGSQGEALKNYGGDGTGVFVLRALRWLKKEQRDNGSWGSNKPAMTALALLAYLAHGDTPGTSEEFGYTVEKAIRFLVESVDQNGMINGRDGHNYTHPIATYALSEAYAMTKNPLVKEAAVKTIVHIIKGQNPHGGWDYNMKAASARNDLSYIGWCVQALKAAKMAGIGHELSGFDECYKKAIDGVKKNYGGRDGYGGFGYSGPGNRNAGLSGVGVLCLQFLGAANSAECKGGVAGLSDWEFNWEEPRAGSFLYYMYYVTQAKFQEGGATWDAWNKQFKPSLMKHQDITAKEASGYVDHFGKPQEIGTWKSPAKREHGEPVMEHILCTLMLEVYYRYLPTFMQVPEEEEIEEEMGDDEDLEIEIVDNGATRLQRPKLSRNQSAEDLSLDLI